MNKKSILIVTSEFPPLPGGIGNHAFLLATYLQRKGYDVSVLADIRSETSDLEFDKSQDFKVYRIKRNLFTYSNRIKKAFSLVTSHDVIIVSGKFSLWLGGLLTCFYSKKKSLAVLHGSELKAGGFFSQGLTKWSLNQFDKYIAVSNFTKNYALQLNPNLKIEVINNGIELSGTIEKIKKNQTMNLVTVGNVTYRKGQQNLIKALPLLKETFPDIQYHCVGIPTEKQQFLEVAKTLKVLDKVVFHGVLSDSEKRKILEKATLFIMLSDVIKHDFEGFGIAILEANAMEIPAVGSENSGIADAIKNGYSGILVNPHDPEAIKKAVVEIVDNHELYSGNAMEWASHFDWNSIIESYIKVIEQ